MTLRALHKWLSIVIGLQVVIWVTSGTIISLLDQQIVTGRSTLQSKPEKQSLTPLTTHIAELVPLSSLELDPAQTITAVSLERVVSKLIYRITTRSGTKTFDAETGASFALTDSQAKRLATTSYGGAGSLLTSEYLANGSEEVHKAGAVWRVAFDDGIATRVYLSALDGSVVAHRNRYWKVVDFLLMLHFMDYLRAHHFNNPQIIIIGFLALWLTISGLLLVKTNFTRRDFTWRGFTR